MSRVYVFRPPYLGASSTVLGTVQAVAGMEVWLLAEPGDPLALFCTEEQAAKAGWPGGLDCVVFLGPAPVWPLIEGIVEPLFLALGRSQKAAGQHVTPWVSCGWLGSPEGRWQGRRAKNGQACPGHAVSGRRR